MLANAPHQFRNIAAEPARLLCVCVPPGQEEFFAAVGDRVASRTAPPPGLDAAALAARMAKAEQLSPRYRTAPAALSWRPVVELRPEPGSSPVRHQTNCCPPSMS